jgi:hypothetical protein
MNSLNSYGGRFAKKNVQVQEDVYKKVKIKINFLNNLQPLPIDTINKFWGVDSRILKHDDTVQKQSFDQSYKNFWSFVDFNSNVNFDNIKNFSSSGVITNKSFSSGSVSGSGLSYMEARRKADEILRSSK